MKNFLKIAVAAFALVAWHAQAVSTPTNAVPISGFTTVSSLTGPELVPVVQGGVNMKATVAQIQASPAAAAAAVQTFANGTSNSLMNTSNVLATTIGATSNSLLSAIQGTNTALNTTIGATSNNLLSAIQGTNSALQSQITTLQAASGQTNLASLTLTNLTAGRVRTPTTQLAGFAVPSATTITTNLDFSQGSFQRVFINLGASSSKLLFNPTNFVDGDNIWLMVTCTNAVAGVVGTGQSPTGGSITLGGNPSTSLSGASKSALLNWQVMGTNNIIFSLTALP